MTKSMVTASNIACYIFEKKVKVKKKQRTQFYTV